MKKYKRFTSTLLIPFIYSMIGLVPGVFYKSFASPATAFMQEPKPLTLEQVKKLITTAPDEALAGEIERRGISFLGDDDIIFESLRALKPGPKTIEALKHASKIKVSIFDYVKCSRHREDLDTFTWMMNNDLISIANAPEFRNHKYLSRLSIVKEKKPFDELNREQMDQYWRKFTIQILTGVCSERNGTGVVESYIYLGPYRGALPDPVRVKFKVEPNDLNPMKQVYVVLLLYCLANEARLNGRDPKLASGYLTFARDTAMDLDKSEQAAEVQPIKKAVNEMLAEMEPSVVKELPAATKQRTKL